jgi:hypothetical protein
VQSDGLAAASEMLGRAALAARMRQCHVACQATMKTSHGHLPNHPLRSQAKSYHRGRHCTESSYSKQKANDRTESVKSHWSLASFSH